MCMKLLRDLGVDEIIINALRNSYGENLEVIQIAKDDADLRLLLKSINGSQKLPQVVTVHRFSKENNSKQEEEICVESSVEDYNCQDTLAFLPDDGSNKSNIRLNGHEVRLSDTSFQLLKYLAQELKRTTGGWAYIQDLVKEGIVPTDSYYPFTRLRSAIAGYLLEKNPKDFIQANGRKQYRISVDPKNISISEDVKK